MTTISGHSQRSTIASRTAAGSGTSPLPQRQLKPAGIPESTPTRSDSEAAPSDGVTLTEAETGTVSSPAEESRSWAQVSPEATAPKLKTPRPGSDMATMVEDLQQTGFSGRAGVGANGTIVMLEDPFFSPEGSASVPRPDEAISSGGPEARSPHLAHPQGHGQMENGLLGGHLGTEVVEQIGHKAHHAAEHLGHHAVEAVGHSAAKLGGKSAGELGGAKAEMLGEGLTALHHGKLGVQEAAQNGMQATQEVARTSGEVAGHLSSGLTTALASASVVSGALAVPLTVMGVKELSHGVKEKNLDKALEGVGNVAVGVRSAAASSVMAGMISASETVAQVAAVGYKALTPLGLVHAGIDTYLGAKDIAKGKKVEGSLKIGFGIAVGAAALGAGLPAVGVAIAFLGAKVGHKIVKSRAAGEGRSQGQVLPAHSPPDRAGSSGPHSVLPKVDPGVER